MLNVEFYNLLMEVSGAIYGAYIAARQRLAEPPPPPPPILQLRSGFAESPGWFLVQAVEFDPEPLTVHNLRVRDVYGSERIVQAVLEVMASEKWLDRRPDDTYHLTTEGRDTFQRIMDRRRSLLGALQPLPAEEMARLETMLRQLIDASLASPTPPDTWCLAHSRRRAPGLDDPALMRLLQYMDDFNAFRDDAHMAAWGPYRVTGHEWEAFATVYDGAADTAEAIFDQLNHRGYSRSDYAAALKKLADRGWLSADGNGYHVTEEGGHVRANTEALTDRYFYTPWSQFGDNAIVTLRSSLERLRDRLNEISQ